MDDDTDSSTEQRTAEEVLMLLLDNFKRIAEAATGMKQQLIDGGFADHIAEHMVAEFVSETVIQPLGIQACAQAEEYAERRMQMLKARDSVGNSAWLSEFFANMQRRRAEG